MSRVATSFICVFFNSVHLLNFSCTSDGVSYCSSLTLISLSFSLFLPLPLIVEVDPDLDKESQEYLEALEQATGELEYCVNLCKSRVMMETCFDIVVSATAVTQGGQQKGGVEVWESESKWEKVDVKGQRSKTSGSEPERLMIESKEEKRPMGKRTNVKVNRCRLQKLMWMDKGTEVQVCYLYSRESLASIRVQLNGTLDKLSTFPVGGRKALTEDDRTPLSQSPESALIWLIPREYLFSDQC